ncbi:hypothetical protein [Shewanella surugensis]|uniref:KfrA N-terminal DNA-binding domain-containing protein n=1 Tax=Shewanella surugensis TaxID=212020 RepID=A0ABT0L9J8_9GAMM|nr:hypothetical protein [Shewanella surugensis]MCL1124361.1 hypothetical protein [Shewanella surugensis]
MSPLENIIMTAHHIESQGRQPSLALIKRQLGTQFPMPLLIQGLQQYKSLSDLEKQQLSQHAMALDKQNHAHAETPHSSTTEQHATEAHTQQQVLQLTQQITLLKQTLGQLTQEHQALQVRVTQLEVRQKNQSNSNSEMPTGNNSPCK